MNDSLCSECGISFLRFHAKITNDFYGRALCNQCETVVIKSGYWTKEKLLGYLENLHAIVKL